MELFSQNTFGKRTATKAIDHNPKTKLDLIRYLLKYSTFRIY